MDMNNLMWFNSSNQYNFENLEGVWEDLSIFPAKLTTLPLNFENAVFSMRDFTYVNFLQFFFLEKYLTII